MKISALTWRRWWRLLFRGALWPAVVLYGVACLGFREVFLGLAFGSLLHGVMLLADLCWCVPMKAESMLYPLLWSFVVKLLLTVGVVYVALQASFPMLWVGLGYLCSMVYCIGARAQFGMCVTEVERRV